MVNKRISALSTASSVADADYLPVDQGSTGPDSGTTRKAAVSDVFTNRTLGGLPKVSANEALAGNGTTQATATPITVCMAQLNNFPGSAYRLPPAVPGLEIFLVNGGSGSSSVFPSSGEEIYVDTLGTLDIDNPQVLALNTGWVFRCFSTAAWYSSKFFTL